MSEVWKRDEIESPCVKICMIHPETKVCTGCYRTGAEIAMWSRMSAEERRTIMEELEERSKKLRRRRGGRKARVRSQDTSQS